MAVFSVNNLFACPCCNNSGEDAWVRAELITVSPPMRPGNPRLAMDIRNKPRHRLCRECGYDLDANADEPVNLHAVNKLKGRLRETSHGQVELLKQVQSQLETLITRVTAIEGRIAQVEGRSPGLAASIGKVEVDASTTANLLRDDLKDTKDRLERLTGIVGKFAKENTGTPEAKK